MTVRASQTNGSGHLEGRSRGHSSTALDVKVAVSDTSGSVKTLPAQMESLGTATQAASSGAEATSGGGSGQNTPFVIEVPTATPRLGGFSSGRP